MEQSAIAGSNTGATNSALVTDDEIDG